MQGTVVEIGPKSCILDVSGVGYKIYTTDEALRSMKMDSICTLSTHLAVRENALDLYGFSDQDSLSLFELLINISGIGPKTAVGIMNVSTPQTLRRAVSSGDLAYLTKVSGIGRKLAEKIILELREKLSAYGEEEHQDLKGETDALEALRSLGYSEREAREALKKIAGEDISAGDKVKKALKVLGGTK